MSFYIGSIIFFGGSIASYFYAQPNWGFVCCGIVLSAVFGKSIAQ